MNAIYNNEVVANTLAIPFNDRALQYGDGLFETIKITNGNIHLLNAHLERLQKGAKALELALPEYLQLELLERDLLELAEKNNVSARGRIKIQVWRKPESQPGYGFTTLQTNCLVTVYESKQHSNTKELVSFAESINYSYSHLSRFKTLNTLPYILADRERIRRKLDELIVLNNEGFICECTSSNIFWLVDKTYFTPSIESGCLEGIMRNEVIKQLRLQGTMVIEKQALPDELMGADQIFTTNSMGISFIKSINGTVYSIPSAGELPDILI